MKLEKLADRFRIDKPDSFRLADIDPRDTAGLDIDKDEAKEMLKDSIQRLSDLQDVLYAQDRWAVLAIFQAMDAAGKDGVIKHVMSGVNPQGCQVFSFKAPTSEDLDHDYMWRCMKCLPARGMIGIFNRSYYEETLVVRVHPQILAGQKLPESAKGKDVWQRRFREINDWERYLTDNGTKIVKLFLNVSKEEQKKRFLDRIQEPESNWKFAASDARERQHWDAYQDAFAHLLSNTSTPWAPWHVIPADRKWFMRVAAASVILDALMEIDPAFPVP